ncbi:MAG: hypothetical protein ACYS5W_10595 [Planctomycetota bacterium]|jgi:hypothetical protein
MPIMNALTSCGILLPLIPLCLPTTAAIPGPRTLHQRLLDAQVVFIARCTKVADKDRTQKRSVFGGNSYKLTVKKVLRDLGRKDPLANYPMLSDLIPGSSMIGQTHAVPTDVDVLIFASRGSKRHLGLLSWCTNSVVPLRGTLAEYPGPKYEKKKIAADDFLKLVEQRIKDFCDFDWLLEQYDRAMGSRHPFSAADKHSLLAVLLALPDKRVPGLARKLNDAGVSGRCQQVLDRYFVKKKQIDVLRAAFDSVLQQAEDGDLAGTEQYRFASGALRMNRPRFERLLDKARSLHEAGDTAYVVRYLMPLYRKGESRVGPLLIDCRVQEVLVDAVRKLETWNKTNKQNKQKDARLPAALSTLAGSRDRAAILAAFRLAFANEDLAKTKAMLALVRKRGCGPAVPATDVTRAKLLGIWQAFWRERSHLLKAGFPKGTVDQLLGTAEGW